MNNGCSFVMKKLWSVFQGISKFSKALCNRENIGNSLRGGDESGESIHLHWAAAILGFVLPCLRTSKLKKFLKKRNES